MAHKRKMALLTLHESNAVLMPTERHIWSKHPIAQVAFRKREKEPVEARPLFKFINSELTGGTHLAHHVYKTIRRQ